MTAAKPTLLRPAGARWPTQPGERLGASVPRVLQAIGPVALLSARKTARASFVPITRPSFDEAIELLARARPARIVVVPYFLFAGGLIETKKAG